MTECHDVHDSEGGDNDDDCEKDKYGNAIKTVTMKVMIMIVVVMMLMMCANDR